MAADAGLKSESMNACCQVWKDKYSKLEEKRNALRQAVNILRQKFDEIQTENVKLSKAYEEEGARANIEKEEKLKEYNARISLENEISSLKSEICRLQQKCSTHSQEGNEEVKVLQARVSDGEKEIKRLKEQLEKRKKRGDSEKKIAEDEKKKAVEAWKLVKAEKSNAEEYKLQLSYKEKEVNEMKSKSACEMLKFKEARKKFETEKHKVITERKRAESEMVKAQELADAYRKKADCLSQQLQEDKKTVDEAKKKLEVEKQKALREKMRADFEMGKAEEQKNLAEENWKKALEAKRSSDQLSQQLQANRKMIEDLKMKIHELSFSGKPVGVSGFTSEINAESTKMKLLKKELQLEKMRVKHAKQKCKLEANRNTILGQELGRLKLEFIQFSHRLNILDKSFSHIPGSIDDQVKSVNVIKKENKKRKLCSLETYWTNGQCENELQKTRCANMDACDPLVKTIQQTAPIVSISGGNCTKSITGIESKLEPLIGGSNRKLLQSSAVNSTTASFSDGQLLGSQERNAFPVATSAKIVGENFNAGPTMSDLSGEVTKICGNENFCVSENTFRSPLSINDKTVNRHIRNRKRIIDAVESIENLYTEGKKLHLQVENKLSDLHGLLHRQIDEPSKGGRSLVPNQQGSTHEKHDRARKKKHDRVRKKRKTSHEKKGDVELRSDSDDTKSAEKAGTGRFGDLDVCRQAVQSTYNLIGSAQAGRERTNDFTSYHDPTITYKEFSDGNYMSLLALDNAADEERYRTAMNVPLSPSLPEIEPHVVETSDANKSKPFSEETLDHEQLMNLKENMFPLQGCDFIDEDINSNSLHANLSVTSHDLRLNDKVGDEHDHVCSELGSLQDNIPQYCVVFSNNEDSSSISRIFCATRNCMARCRLVTETDWAVNSILLALTMEHQLLSKEKVCVLLSLLLLNFWVTSLRKFGELLNGSLLLISDSYAEHIHTVISDAETRILFSECGPLDGLFCLIEEFLIDGRVMAYNDVPYETSTYCDSRNHFLLDGLNISLSSRTASCEQLLAGSIILASICAVVDHIGFICEASYNVFRMSRQDSSLLLTILHVFAYLGGDKIFSLSNYGLVMTVLKSIVLFLESGSPSVASASCLSSINRLHAELYTGVKCPFSEGAASVDSVISLLLEMIGNYALQKNIHRSITKPICSSTSRFLSDDGNVERHPVHEVVRCDIDLDCDVLCCLNNYMVSAASDVAINATMCHLSDVLSLVELVACKMSWSWTCIKIVPELLRILKLCVVDNIAAALIVLLGQLGRLGVDSGGFEDEGVKNLRGNLFSYLGRESTMKSGHLQIATATALLGLFPLDLKTLHANIPASASVSTDAEVLRKWFSQLSKDKQDFSVSLFKSSAVLRNSQKGC
ncbi:Maternal effect embryo arrest protein [Quillaja saponaria]|uniref:Maternal effect embryo arrest protein n=1 Tax=Quillaja saponaria TaxID=32244 RepID=A0AAD7M5K9_QUISA|nr:Maternal effect embryo arrest protein [Quillaja saponaria]